MKTNVQSQIKIPKSGFKRSKLPWSHDVNTTFGWGEVQPTECKFLVPGSKTVVRNKGLVRFAPMVAPTFGRVRYKSFSQFVPVEDIFPNFASMMTQEPKSNYSGTKIQDRLLNAPLAHISSWAFMGARATMYFAIPTNDGKSAQQNAESGNYITWYRQGPRHTDTQSDWQQWFDKIKSGFIFGEADTFNHNSNQVLPEIHSIVIRLNSLGGLWSNLFPADCDIRLCCKNSVDLCPVRRDYEPDLYNGDSNIASFQREVTFESADFVLEASRNVNGEDVYFAIAFEFSDFGKRIRKIIQGLGYQVSLTSIKPLCVLPFFAEYKAYFDVFQPQLYQSWETTWAMKYQVFNQQYFQSAVAFYPTSKTNLSTLTDYRALMPFMLMELGDQWYIERPDFYGAHLERLAVSPLMDTSGFLSVNSLGQVKEGANITVDSSVDSDGVSDTQRETNSVRMASGANLPYINQLQHGFVDATLLNRMTRWINKYSILGRVYDKIMRAFGLGKYLDSVDSKFIGNTDKMLTISDVVSLAATSDAVLGEYGGKGLEYFEEDKQVFENDVFGYWITISCVVPEAGYTQCLDTTLDCIRKSDMYQADFDAIGMEATTKETFCSTEYISSLTSENNVSHTYGFIPRQSKWKVHKNLVNGDFNRHGLRNVYLPYTLDKQLNVNDFAVRNSDYKNPQGSLFYNFVRLSKSKRNYALPCAGIWSRTPTKFSWLGNFDRIFAKLDDTEKYDLNDTDTSLGQIVGWADFNRDNFMFHQVSEMNCWAPVKPIEESYGIDQEDENPNQNGVEYVVKA